MAIRDTAIGSMISSFRKEARMSQEDFAEHLHLERSYISRIESGDREWPEAHDAILAKMNWRFALKLGDERTGGYISNILDEVPNVDLHPAALKEWLLTEISELQAALEGLVMAKHIDPEQKKQTAERIWHEMRDVQGVAGIYQGVIEEQFGLDREQLIKQHNMQLKNGER